MSIDVVLRVIPGARSVDGFIQSSVKPIWIETMIANLVVQPPDLLG